MYFVKRGSDIHHILEDTQTGAAPCGQMVDRIDMWAYQQGRPTENIKEEVPDDKSFCKHCQKMRGE